MSDRLFPDMIEIAEPHKDLLSQLSKTYPSDKWTEVAIYQLVRVKRVRWVPEVEDA